MKKTAVICSLFLAFAGTAFANDNTSSNLHDNNINSVVVFDSDKLLILNKHLHLRKLKKHAL